MAHSHRPTDKQLKETLTEEEYHVLREAGTESPFTGKYYDHHEEGMYACRACNAPLFSSDTKFESGSGWPSFWEKANPDAITYVDDMSHGMKRTEVRCANCDSHLGHLFDDGPADKTGKRYCINSLALNFEDKP